MPSRTATVQELTAFQVDSFDATNVHPDQIVDSLRRNGGCFVRNYISSSSVSQILSDVSPYLEADVPWEGEFFPKETRRVCGLAGKSPTYMDKIIATPLFTAVSESILTTNLTSWLGEEKQTYSAGPQVNATTVLSIGPGAKAQGLHRDDIVHYNKNPALDNAEQWTPERETAVGIFVAGTKATKGNGATRFVPQSHLDDSTEGPGDEKKAVYAELEVGDAFIMLASCFHGGSANTTSDETRILFGSFLTRGHLRQEENQYLANSIEKVKMLPEHIQKLIGYTVNVPYCGWVDLKDPFQMLHKEDGKDMVYRDLSKV
jgi:ectoine hydroxylase-related dioxygenase (phytanoyl-CoA dioxygenase family)